MFGNNIEILCGSGGENSLNPGKVGFAGIGSGKLDLRSGLFQNFFHLMNQRGVPLNRHSFPGGDVCLVP